MTVLHLHERAQLLLGARFDLRARFGKLAQALLAQRQFFRDRHAVRNIRCIRSLGLGHQIGDLGLAELAEALRSLHGPDGGPRDFRHTLFEMMSAFYRGFSLAEIARRTGINASSVSRLLATLVEGGLVEHVQDAATALASPAWGNAYQVATIGDHTFYKVQRLKPHKT